MNAFSDNQVIRLRAVLPGGHSWRQLETAYRMVYEIMFGWKPL